MQIDFHTHITDKLHYVCRLIRKAHAKLLWPPRPCSIVALTPDSNALMTLDNALWTFSAHDFLPHVCVNQPFVSQTPILLTTPEHPDPTALCANILINLSNQFPTAAMLIHVERLIEIITDDPEDLACARKRYRVYQQEGYSLNHFIIKK